MLCLKYLDGSHVSHIWWLVSHIAGIVQHHLKEVQVTRPQLGPIMGNLWVTRWVPAPTPAWNPYPWAQVQVFMDMGMGTCRLCRYQNPCGSGPWVACASTWQGGNNPSYHVNSCFWCSRKGETLPIMSTHVCVCNGVLNGRGEQLGRGGRGGRGLEFENIPFIGMGMTAHSHLPTSALLCSGSCPGCVVVSVVVWRLERVVVICDTCDVWWSECLEKPAKPRPWVWIFGGWLWNLYLSHPYLGTHVGLQTCDRP